MYLQAILDENYPKYYEYEVIIEKDVWKTLLQDRSIFTEDNIEHMKCIYEFINHAATCKEVSERLGGSPQKYIGLVNGLAKRIISRLGIQKLPQRRNKEEDVYWYVLFLGRELRKYEITRQGNFEWKLRSNLADALKELYPDLTYIQPYLVDKSEDVQASVWLAAAVLAYDVYLTTSKPTANDFYFKGSIIQNLARKYSKQEVHYPGISQWYNADHENHNHKYLRSGPGSSKRLTYPGEFNGNKERPTLPHEGYLLHNDRLLSVKELLEFTSTKYKRIIQNSIYNSSDVEIDCISILDYLEEHAGKSYENPDNADEERKHELLQIKKLGSDAVSKLDIMAELCAQEFNLLKNGNNRWLDTSGNTIRHYLWKELKLPGYEPLHTSISIFAELVNGEARFKISLELNESKSNPDDYDRHHRLLNKEITDAEDKLFYIASEKQNEYEWTELKYSTVEIKQMLKDGLIRKIQLAKVITRKDIITESIDNSGILQGIKKAVSALMPYYRLALGLEEKEQGEGHNMMEKSGEHLTTHDKNIILYGPPGTGKTYHSVTYAVAIIEGKSLESVQSEQYALVYRRYEEYKAKGRIAFTTFHQSYGYEEFIEGIKPKISQDNDSSNDLNYEYASGIFKVFCERANIEKVQSSNYSIRENAAIWSVLLGGTGNTSLKTECFINDYIKIGWQDAEETISNNSVGLNSLEKRILLNFQEEMQVGDIVLIPDSNTSIDAIGVITGEYYYDHTNEDYPRTRKVQWIVKNVHEDILELNANVKFDRKSVYPLRNMNLSKVSKIIEKHSVGTSIQLEHNNDPYVFIIDEINRGNISKIFGELITLIETTKRIGSSEPATAILPYTGDKFGVPQNVYILGTMNTADRSIALMDTALRRRFKFIEMMPDETVLSGILTDRLAGINIVKMLKSINERITYLYDREHTIGHAFFTSLLYEPSIERLAGIFKNSIIPLLQEYFYEDYSKIQLILGDNAKLEPQYKFILDETIKVKEVFKGTPDIDLPEKKYTIQYEAFFLPESYKFIY